MTGNAGLYYVAYHLSLLGWNVMPTARNARGIDLIAYDATGTNFLGVQVKALSKRNAVPLPTDLDRLMGDWWVIVMNVATGPVAYIMTPEEVRNASHPSGVDGNVSFLVGAAAVRRSSLPRGVGPNRSRRHGAFWVMR